MSKIQVLDQHTIDKIAAGEVVERPASVVKELVENSIDAGANSITVEIKDGGKSMIRITDNGAGMTKEDVSVAFLRHATSKIRKVEDLEGISTLGFRGEALSSISAVSQVELITKSTMEPSGIRYIIEGGQQKNLEEIGAPDGTTFLIRNLFFNVPARSKFLKTAQTEGSYISNLMEQLALSHSNISFTYIVNQQIKLTTSGNGNEKEVIYQIYGRDITRELQEVQGENTFMSLKGYIGKPTVSRGNRNFENYYVNGRFVKHPMITKAIEDAYKGFVMQHRFPFVSLQINMTGNDLDVNVHPTKREVRFANQEQIYHTIYRTLSDALHEKELIPEMSSPLPSDRKVQTHNPIKKTLIPEPFEHRRLDAQKPVIPAVLPSERTLNQSVISHTEPAAPVPAPKRAESTLSPGPKAEPSIASKTEPKVPILKEQQVSYPEKTNQMELFDNRLLSEKARMHHVLIGQLFETYWLVQYGDNFYIIDQHAAHEKVIYERLKKDFLDRKFDSQMISPPVVVSFSLIEETVFLREKKTFESFGFQIEPFGGREYSISAVPNNLIRISPKEFFVELLDHMGEESETLSMEIFGDKLATSACKAAIKGNHKLSSVEADRLIDELLHLEDPYHCPHGRPTIVTMSKTKIEKMFKRIV